MDLKVAASPESPNTALTITLLSDETVVHEVREIKECLIASSDALTSHVAQVAGKIDDLKWTLAKWATASIIINTATHIILKFTG